MSAAATGSTWTRTVRWAVPISPVCTGATAIGKTQSRPTIGDPGMSMPGSAAGERPTSSRWLSSATETACCARRCSPSLGSWRRAAGRSTPPRPSDPLTDRRCRHRSSWPLSPMSCRARRPQARPLFANLQQPCTAGLPTGNRPMRAWQAASSRWPQSAPGHRRTWRPTTPPRSNQPTDKETNASVDQAVKFGRVLASDLVNDVGRPARELLLDVFRGFRPHAVGVRIIGAPHQRFDADVVDELGADPVELERRAALPAPIFARLQLHQVAEPIPVLEIHAVERVGQPADAALAQPDAE